VRHLTEELSELIQRLLAPLAENEFELNACFGHCADSRYDPLSRQLFSLLQIPLLCARFERHKDLWSLRGVRPVGANAGAQPPENPRARYCRLFLRQDSMGKKTSSSTF
jgi:hypothetical protein